MKHLLLLLCILTTTLSFAQDYHRINGETPEIFVRRIARVTEFAHPVIETNAWDSNYKSIVYFLPVRMKEAKNIIGFLLVPTNTMLTYRKILIDTFFQEGGDPEIKKVLFTNADNDKEQELIIMSSCPLNHPAAGIVGTSYRTSIFDNPSATEREYELKYFKDLSDKLDGGFEGKRNKEMVKAEYKDAGEIKAALRRLGY